jgi:nickel-dependent lactate racemase
VQAIPGDIVITSNGGAPLDQNIYQAVKGLTAAEASAKEGAVLIMCADLADGTGGEGFYLSLKNCKTPADHFATCAATPQSETIPDQWESQILARILSKFHVVLISHVDPGLVTAMKMHPAKDLPHALQIAEHLLGFAGSITVIPEGISTIIR